MILAELGPVTVYRMHTPRRELWFNQCVEPPTWALADEVLAAGAKGVLFPSTLAAGGSNVVLYNGTLAAGDTLEVNDPGAALPRNQDSWR